ncbi:MAG: hypothetical protein A3D44_02130 [Candidatus Staskawiczbacteria bacterium RIFCSPHIGHO2_02_FULL_42_22]|uniref:HIT domain-containing protein n=1 Tax=Candidatus Staskawiczbacteria bacterium RIFCSPHIGHO2_02_FULL_42_22 TaxID=1802207 RepID=A0A1G2I1S9_9BACT|nr:MAG: hypothetical protein A3D44_02130 [Candidatus Staskawiczbacteria bacterium RIFCSPHIGHO2_02_FULL_42_22]
MDCIFCKIVSGEIDSAKVFEDEHVLAFLDVNPNTRGHCLVIPKIHVEDIFDISEDVLQKVIVVGRALAIKMKDALNADGVHLSNNNGIHAGQIVHHFHLHVIPRYKDDALVMYGPRPDNSADMEELKKLAKEISG